MGVAVRGGVNENNYSLNDIKLSHTNGFENKELLFRVIDTQHIHSLVLKNKKKVTIPSN